MHLLMLCEGDAENPARSGSGTPTSLLEQLRAAGHRVTPADVDLYGLERWVAAALSFSPGRRRWGVKYHLGRLPFGMRSRRAALGAARAGRVDAVLQYGATFQLRGGHGMPYFLYCDSNLRMAAHDAHSWAASLDARELDAAVARERAVYAAATRIFTFSDRVRRSFIEDFGIPDSRLLTVYAGPNLELGRIPDRRPPRPSDRPPTILFVGREFERKGGDVALAALARVREELPAARLRVIGPTSLSGAPAGVDFLGFLRKDRPDDLQRLLDAYATADVFCFPTRFEPFGIVVLEAMLFGLPCVASAAWAIPEMVVTGETGYTVPVDDVAGFAARLLEVLRDPERAARMGLAGRARALRHFTWQAVAEKMTRAMQAPR